MKETNMIGFKYGPMCDELEKQANEQGFTLGKDAVVFERRREAIATLMFGNILPDGQIDKAYQKLHKQVIKALKPIKEVKE